MTSFLLILPHAIQGKQSSLSKETFGFRLLRCKEREMRRIRGIKTNFTAISGIYSV